MKKISLATVVCLLFIFAITSVRNASAQAETGQLSGTVTDANGGVIANTTVTVRSTLTGLTRTTTTNEDGIYTFVNLPPSTYEVTLQTAGFEDFKAIKDVSVGGKSELNATLGIKGQQVVVDVVGSSVGEINTTDQQLSKVITSKQLTTLPTISTNPYGFVSTLGNVSEDDPSGRGAGVAINGQRAASTSILINGGENVDTFTATPGQAIPLDSVEEFRVIQGTFTADYGRATGGVVNLVTKSGRNNFFGSAYIFNRNSRFASAGFDANARGIGRQFFNRNDYGFSVGGPIVKNKLLFFSNLEWNKVRSNATLQALVPSAASLAAANANTRAFFAAYTQGATPAGAGSTTYGSVVPVGTPSSCIDPRPTSSTFNQNVRCLAFQKVQYTVPSDTGAGSPTDNFQIVNRVDWNATSKFNMYGVYALQDVKNLIGSVSNSPYTGFSTTNTDFNQNFQVAGTYLFSSNLTSATRFTYNRLKNSQPLGDRPVGPTLYFKGSGNSLDGTSIAFPGYLPFSPGSAIPFGGPQNLYTVAEDLTYLWGNHNFKAGAQIYRINDSRVFGAFQNSVQILGGSNTQATDNFFAGQLLQFQGAINPQGRFPGQTITLPVQPPEFGRNNTYNEFAGYLMDTWRVLRGLSLNLGLRYEYYGPQRNKDRSLDSNFYFGSGSNFFEEIRNGTVQIAKDSPVGELWKADKNNFAPSVGFAWDVNNDGRSSLRGGYALRYERNFGNVTFNVIQNPPNYAVISITPADVGGPIPITLNNSGPLGGSTGSITLPRTSLRQVRPNIVNAYAHQWSLGYERRILNSLSASATYSGSAGRDLYTIENINRIGSGVTHLGSAASCPGLSASSRLNCRYSNINSRANNGISNYHGLTFSVEGADIAKTGLTLTSYYTYSKTKDNLSSTFSESGNNYNLGLLDPFNPKLDYGNSDFDVRNRWVTSFIWDIPAKRWTTNRAARAILGGWNVSGIYRVQSGAPFTFYDCSFAVTVCVRLIPTGPVNSRSTGITPLPGANSFSFLSLAGSNPVDIGSTTANENGPYPANMLRRNSFRGPGSWHFDAALSRTIRFSERFGLTLRMDAANLFNRANYSIYGGETDIETADFVRAGKFGRRLLRFGARFSF